MIGHPGSPPPVTIVKRMIRRVVRHQLHLVVTVQHQSGPLLNNSTLRLVRRAVCRRLKSVTNPSPQVNIGHRSVTTSHQAGRLVVKREAVLSCP